MSMKMSLHERAEYNRLAQTEMTANIERVREENAPSPNRHAIGFLVTITWTPERKQDAEVLGVRESDHYGPSYQLKWNHDGIEYINWITGQRVKAAKKAKA